MTIDLLFLFGLCSLCFWFYINIKKRGLLWIAIGLLQIGILILFFQGFFTIFFNLPHNIYIRIIFFITYIWCTVGINVNFIIPLIKLIDQKIDKE